MTSVDSSAVVRLTDRPPIASVDRGDADRALAVRLGFWSAIVTAASMVAFLLGGAIGSVLFPSTVTWTGIADFAANYSAWGMALTVVPSLMIAPSFLALAIAVDVLAPAGKRVLGRLAVAFAIVYVTTIGANYFLQLTAVRHALAGAALDGLGLLAMSNLRGIFWSLEMAGYFWQEVALVLAAFALTGGRLTYWIRGFAGLTFVGAVLSVTAGMVGIDSFTSPLFLMAAIPSSIGYPLATGLFAVHFRRY